MGGNRSREFLARTVAYLVFMALFLPITFSDITPAMSVDNNVLECDVTVFENQLNQNGIGEIYWSKDNQLAIFAKDSTKQFVVLDLVSSELSSNLSVWELPLAWHPTIAQISWNSEGTRVAVSENKIVQVLDIQGSLLYQMDTKINGVAWSPDGQFLAVGNIKGPRSSINVLETHHYEPYFEIEDGLINNLTWHPTKNLIALPHTFETTSGESYGVRIYDIDNKQGRESLYLEENFLAEYETNLLYKLIWISDGQFLIAEFDNIPADPVIWDINSHELVDAKISSTEAWDDFENFIVLIKVFGDKNTIEIWNILSMNLVASKDFDEPIFSVQWSPNGHFIAVANKDRVEVCKFS